LSGWCKDELLVTAPLGFAAVECDVVLHGDEHVLQARAAQMVGMDVARHDRADVERGRQVAERRIPSRIPAYVRALELHVETVASEDAGEVGSGVRLPDAEPVARAARKTDETLV